MNTAVRRSIAVSAPRQSRPSSNGIGHTALLEAGPEVPVRGVAAAGQRPRVYIAAENRLLREALSRTLAKRGEIAVVDGDASAPLPEGETPQNQADDRAGILLLSSKGNLDEDLSAIRSVRSQNPGLLILLIDAAEDETSFLQCIRCGVRGYLLQEASAEDVVGAVKAAHEGKAVCPGTLCAALFRYLEREASSFPSARVHERLGLTRREQQLIPLIAEGLTNKEIANHLCLSEQTVKNHLYRMKQKIGADGRLGIVQVCRTQGFMV